MCTTFLWSLGFQQQFRDRLLEYVNNTTLTSRNDQLPVLKQFLWFLKENVYVVKWRTVIYCCNLIRDIARDFHNIAYKLNHNKISFKCKGTEFSLKRFCKYIIIFVILVMSPKNPHVSIAHPMSFKYPIYLLKGYFVLTCFMKVNIYSNHLCNKRT